MSQNEYKVTFGGKTYVLDGAGFDRWQMNLMSSASESAKPEKPETSQADASIDGYTSLGVLANEVSRNYHTFPKGSLVIGKPTKQGNMNLLAVDGDRRTKVGKSDVKMTATEGSKRQAADNNYTAFSGQLVIAGQTLNCRVAEGKLRNGGEATTIHFADDIRQVDQSDEIRRVLKDSSFRFSHWLTKQTDDSKSTWYINTLMDISQIQALFDDAS